MAWRNSWNNWKAQCDWTPQKNHGRQSKNQLWQAEVQKNSEAIRAAFDQGSEADDGTPRPKRKAAGDTVSRGSPMVAIDAKRIQGEKLAAEKRNAAVRIKASVAYRATLAPHQTSLIAAVDAELDQARQLTRSWAIGSAQVQEEDTTEAIEAMAKAQARVTRATKHLESAQLNMSQAEVELKLRTADLRELKARKAKKSQSHQQGQAQGSAAKKMATSFMDLKNSSQWQEDGRVSVDPSILERLSEQLQLLAMQLPPSSARAPSRSPPARNSRRRLFGKHTAAPGTDLSEFDSIQEQDEAELMSETESHVFGVAPASDASENPSVTLNVPPWRASRASTGSKTSTATKPKPLTIGKKSHKKGAGKKSGDHESGASSL